MRRTRYTRNPRPRTHPPVASGVQDYRGVEICERCGSTWPASVHGPLPERDEHEKAVEARKVGERDG